MLHVNKKSAYAKMRLEEVLTIMKKILFLLLMLFASTSVYAVSDEDLQKENSIQARINNVGMKILNSNKFKSILFRGTNTLVTRYKAKVSLTAFCV